MNPEIIIIGAAIIDILVRPASEEVFHTGTYGAEEIRMSTGADAMNEAMILARMGRRVQMETILGQDEAGRYLLERCREEGIEIPEHCIREQLPTGINVVLVEENGERHFLTSSAGSLRHLSLSDVEMPFPESAEIICFASMFVFPNINAPELRTIFSQAKAQGKVLCVDMTKRKQGETVEEMAPALKYVDYLFPNAAEACLLTGLDEPSDTDPEAWESTVAEAAERLLAVDVKNCVIKCGAKGCYVRNGQDAFWVPAEEGVSCVDTTGAGDSFVAGFLNGLLEGKSLWDCAREGNNCGARSIGEVGAVTWSEEL